MAQVQPSHPSFRLAGDDGVVLTGGQAAVLIKDLSTPESDFALVELVPPLTGFSLIEAEPVRFAVLHPRNNGGRLFPLSHTPLPIHVAVARRQLRSADDALKSWDPAKWVILIWALLEMI